MSLILTRSLSCSSVSNPSLSKISCNSLEGPGVEVLEGLEDGGLLGGDDDGGLVG